MHHVSLLRALSASSIIGDCLPRRGTKRRPVVASLALPIIAASSAPAATNLWLGDGANGNWAASGNFTSVVTSTDSLQFAGSKYLTTNFNNIGPTLVDSIQFNAEAGAFTLVGNDLGLTSGIGNLSSNLQTIGLDLWLRATQTWDAGAGGLRITAPVEFRNTSGTTSLTVTGAGGTELLGGIRQAGTGTGSLIKAGTGTLTLGGSGNNYSGGTTVTGGLINFSSAANFGTGSISLNGGGLQWAAGTSVDISNRLSAIGGSAVNYTPDAAVFDTNGNNVTLLSGLNGGAILTKQGSGTLTLRGVNTYSGGTLIEEGTLRIGPGGSLSHWLRYTGSGPDFAAIGMLTVGDTGTGGFIMDGGDVTTASGYIGFQSTGVGNVTVNSGTWHLTFLHVGVMGTGHLLLDGGAISASQPVGIGTSASGNGTMIVKSGSLDASWPFFVGAEGSGHLSLQGGNITTGQAILGSRSGSLGTVEMTGGVWDSGEIFSVGDEGSGSLLMNGGSITAGIAWIGSASTGSGTATIQDGSFTIDGRLDIGRAGVGSLTITGGSATADLGTIGAMSSGDGSVTVRGGTFTLGEGIAVGDSGRGTLLIDGGTVDSGASAVGSGASGEGSVTVTSGAWTNTSAIVVGGRGTGTLVVSGGSVSSGLSVIFGMQDEGEGHGAISNGSLQTTNLAVGMSGRGTFDMSGGTLTTANTEVGSYAPGSGTMSVTGGRWMNSAQLLIGGRSTGALAIDGGEVSSATTVVGWQNSGSGTATVSSGSWTMSGELVVGALGAGYVTVNGGAVGASDITLGSESNFPSHWGTGTMTIADGTLDVSGDLTVGGYGDGFLVMNGGAVTSTNGYVGRMGRSRGSVTMNGGTWDLTGKLSVGRGGTGSLVLNGGRISSAGGEVGYAARGDATIHQGTWSNSGELRVGTNFAGRLDIRGTSASRGLVETVTLRGGAYGLGIPALMPDGALNFDGGVLRALADEPIFVAGFNPGKIVINSGGAFIDSNGFDIGIINGFSGTGRLTKLGDGTLTLDSANTYTGGTTIQGGVLAVGTGGTTGSIVGDIVNNGALRINRSDAFTLGGVISGGGSLTQSGTGTLTLSGANTYAGGTTVNTGTLAITGSVYHPDADLRVVGTPSTQAALNLNAGGSLTSSNGEIGIGSINVSGGTWTNSGSILVGSYNGASLDISGGRVTTSDLRTGSNHSGLTSPARIKLSGGILETGQVRKDGDRTASFTFAGGLLRLTGNQSSLFSGFPSGTVSLSSGGGTIDTQTFNVASAVGLNGSGSLTKTGSGTLTLSGANTYTGATAVQEGKFIVNGSLANTAVTIHDGATLGGGGSIDGITTLLAGATLAPGNSPGTLTFTNGLDLAGDSILDFELGATSDLIVVSDGAFTGPSDGVVTINLTDSGGFAAGIYNLIDATGAKFTDVGSASFELGATIAGYTYSLDFFDSALQLTAVASAIPEPSSAGALAGCGVLGLAAFRRRRVRSKS